MNKNVLNKLEAALEKQEYKSNFNFEKFEIREKSIIDLVIQKEKLISRKLDKYNESLFDICEAVYDISVVLKVTNSFMEWYEGCGLTKDMISMYLKRHSLYQEFPNYKNFISALTDSAIKVLTNKDVTYDNRLMIVDKRMSNTQDIKEFLQPCIEKTKEEFKKEIPFFNTKRIKKMKKRVDKIEDPKELKSLVDKISAYKKEIKEIEQLLKEKEKEFENKNNLQIEYNGDENEND